jgi:DNA-binding NarL/FixJ family response regulator
MESKIHVLIADDQAISREGFQRILEREDDMEIVGVVPTAPEVLQQVRDKNPDVVLLDLKWYHDDQAMTAVISQLRRECPKTSIIGVTVYDHLMRPAKDAGAKWVVTKDIGRDELLRLIRAAHATSLQETETTPEVESSLRELAKLRQNLVDFFSEDELRTLCFDMGIDYETLPAAGKDSKARELVAYIERRGLVSKFTAICRNRRPNVSWGDMWEATKRNLRPGSSTSSNCL